VPNYFIEELDEPLREGLVMTIEPIIAAGRGDVVETDDGWTVKTADGSPVAHAEHTLVIQRGAPLIITA
jgi:methionyl aminopeptidase